MSILLRWHNLFCEPFADGAESPPTLRLDLAETSAERGRAKQPLPHTHILTLRLIQPMHALLAVKDHSDKNISYFPIVGCKLRVDLRTVPRVGES